MTALPRPQGDQHLGTKAETKLTQAGQQHTVQHNHSQWCGSWTYEVTRFEGEQVFGKWISGTVYELDPEDCM